MKEKAKILPQRNFQKRGIQLKRGDFTPLVYATQFIGGDGSVTIRGVGDEYILFWFYWDFLLQRSVRKSKTILAQNTGA